MGRSLEQLQRWMQEVISHAEGITAGVDSNAARDQIDVGSDEVEQVILPSQALDSISRLQVYGNAYFARLMECLRESFPTVEHAIGREAFDEFAFGYLQSFPSESYTLNDLGNRFIEYLEATRPDREERERGEIGFPDFLIDLMRLEWSIERVFDGPGFEGQAMLSADTLRAVPADRWPQARLTPAVCLRLLEFQFPVNDYFTAVRQQREPEFPLPEPSFMALTRRNFVVRRFPLSQAEHVLLAALMRGETVGQAIATAAEHTTDDDATLAASLGRWFQDWTQVGFFQSLELPD